MESIFKLGILLRVTDMASGAVGRIGQSITKLGIQAEALSPTFEKFKTIGMPLLAAGAVMIAMLAGTVNSTVATQKALGELASVGVKDMKALETAGTDFSNKWAGTTKAQFIAAAYDIKGGIASLSDVGVAEFAKLAALTGKATKSTTQEMTSLFATAYGIYKDQYAMLNDMQFGQMFSGGIAAAVNIFKSTGTGMAGAIENLGAAATVAKRPLEEQLTVLGMLQATMSGREAGTAYKAFIRDVDAAGIKLGMNFYDAAGNLKSIDNIMGLLRGKFGDLSGKESAVLQKAFSDESYRLVAQMYTKVDDLTGNIQQLSAAMAQGTLYTEQMASAMNQDIGAGMGILGQRIHNLAESLGKQLIPILAPLFTALGNGVTALQQFAENHGTLTRVVMVSLAVIAALTFVFGGLATVIGVIGLGVPAVVAGMGMIASAVNIATVKVWAFNVALSANPLAWVVIAIGLVIGALVWLYNSFETVEKVIDGFAFGLGVLTGSIVKMFLHIPEIARTMVGALKSVFTGLTTAIPAIFRGLYTSGQMIIGTLVDGIKSAASGPVDAIKGIFAKIRNLLPFSDAKEGPLSQLTLSGSRIMSTLGEGILGAAPSLQKTMAAALAGTALSTSIAVAAVPAPTSKDNRPVIQERSTSRGERQIIIQGLTVQLHGVANANDFVKQLQSLVEGYDAT